MQLFSSINYMSYIYLYGTYDNNPFINYIFKFVKLCCYYTTKYTHVFRKIVYLFTNDAIASSMIRKFYNRLSEYYSIYLLIVKYFGRYLGEGHSWNL